MCKWFENKWIDIKRKIYEQINIKPTPKIYDDEFKVVCEMIETTNYISNSNSGSISGESSRLSGNKSNNKKSNNNGSDSNNNSSGNNIKGRKVIKVFSGVFAKKLLDIKYNWTFEIESFCKIKLPEKNNQNLDANCELLTAI
ncbi:hypothetical protein GLOIN_2v1488103 [Rhizophagus irregularis DAOM 181602=DAOM 197198]|uniref:Uncharacterized protein n=1 Tax=Rhizophagus irregularis (strain DAOM 181602 / DAOM 197198 / MUCL 43194) TaxID=747089 RepID=A0A2P4P139_RHIID|nr:hypothetical protein GLOIN_2v1488103 [Rhizophagus irregularis DAOM 181602=DAOM 197198]POG59093.1 hypothetical protein GLOIN_2v1488103 [Rhizophagus irregularis DAOM 181602=DAOM 197198]|eukprot:XP_025165959.1 hypothetical protein GLOIN_2v1488103 [Rhizophagus irregularis DAOM 181602=DAOM 197198]